MTSTVRDEAYQQQLVRRNREATRNYSLHTTGWAFDVARDYASRRQALAFQFVLDRLQVLDAIAWVREPGAIHITVVERREVAAAAARAARLGRGRLGLGSCFSASAMTASAAGALAAARAS